MRAAAPVARRIPGTIKSSRLGGREILILFSFKRSNILAKVSFHALFCDCSCSGPSANAAE